MATFSNNEMSVCSVIKHTLRDVTARVRPACQSQERLVFKEGAKAACFRAAVLRFSVRYRRIIMTCGSCKAAVGEHVHQRFYLTDAVLEAFMFHEHLSVRRGRNTTVVIAPPAGNSWFMSSP